MTQVQEISGESAIAVIVVEDEPLVRLVATDVLCEAGYRVIEAGNADEALVLLEARPETRVMITDVRMPGSLDGFGLAQVTARRWPDIAIVVMSGHALPEASDLPKGAAFLPKPWQPSALVEQVQRMIAARH